MLLPDLVRPASGVGPLAREQLVEDEPDGVDVAAGRGLAPRELLGGHVGGSPRPGLVAVDRARQAGQAEVCDAHVAAPVEHDVLRLEVAMDHSFVVGGGHPGAELPRDLHGLVTRQVADPAQERRQVFPVHVLHGQEGLAVRFANVVHPADRGVRDLPRHASLVVEAAEPLGILAQRGGQELEGHRLPEHEVLRAVHLAHATPAQQLDHAIPIQQQGPREEPPAIDGWSRGAPATRARGVPTRRRTETAGRRGRSARRGRGAGRRIRDVEGHAAARAELRADGHGIGACGALGGGGHGGPPRTGYRTSFAD